jgi:hypothetical protein
MIHSNRYRVSALALCLFVAFVAASAWPTAQSAAKKALTAEDYTKWRSIAGEQISGDGNWVASVLQLTNVVPADAKPPTNPTTTSSSSQERQQ